MVPTINAMMVVGLVDSPGMMTGQLLGGVPPLQAVMYQIVIMFLLAAATSLGTVGVVLLAYRRLFNQDHQFLYRRHHRTPLILFSLLRHGLPHPSLGFHLEPGKRAGRANGDPHTEVEERSQLRLDLPICTRGNRRY